MRGFLIGVVELGLYAEVATIGPALIELLLERAA